MPEPEEWQREENTPSDAQLHRVARVIFDRHTRYQHARIIDSGFYGRKFFLDGDLQSATLDEFIYHESLVHPALAARGSPLRVLVLGGGEGATLREVLRWRTVDSVDMVDIDGEVVEACATHLGMMHQGAFDDPRAHVVIADAVDFVQNAAQTGMRWDVVISDITSPSEDGPGNFCFTREYFAAIAAVLHPDGILATQSGPIAPGLIPLHARVMRTVGAVFAHAASYSCAVASFGQSWGFTLASALPIAARLAATRVGSLLTEQITSPLRYLDARLIEAMLAMPVYVREAIAADTSIYTSAALPGRISASTA